MLEAIGWAACCFNILGSVLIAKRYKIGWVAHLFGCAGWTAYAYIQHGEGWRPLLAINIIFACTNLYGWMQWSKVLGQSRT